MTKLQTKTAIAHIERIRVRNNRLWMQLLRLAMDAHPIRARNVIAKISKNDREITKWLKRV